MNIAELLARFPDPRHIDLSLDRVRRFLEALDAPHEHLPPVVHVAGTNGKGSVIAFLAAMLEAAGRRVHIYTSPHLLRLNERIRIAGEEIGDAALTAHLERCLRLSERCPVTFFEATTAAAFLAFAERPADVLLLETGLGGRLDATNVIDRPLLTVITPISVDHVEFLGDSLAAIAAEKAGILKPGVPCVVAPQVESALHVLRDRATGLGAPLLIAGEDWHLDPHTRHYAGPRRRLALPRPALAGGFQYENAAVALACLEAAPLLGIALDAARRGIEGARWPGRLQSLPRGRLGEHLPPGWDVWLDGGHNPGAGEVLAAELARWSDRPPRLICGMLQGKDTRGFLRPLAPFARELVAVAVDSPRGRPPEEVASDARAVGIPSSVAGDVTLALSRWDRSDGPGRVLIAGSLALAGDVLRRCAFRNQEGKPDLESV